MNKTRRRVVQKHRAKGLKFEQRRKAESGGAPPPRPRAQAAAAPARSRPAARDEEASAGGTSA